MPLWANYLVSNPFSPGLPASGFVYVGTGFQPVIQAGPPSVVVPTYTITAINPATPYQAGGGGANPLPPTIVNAGDTITVAPAIGGVSTFPTSILAVMIRVSG